MFADFFYLLRAHGVPVSLTEWMTLMEALARGMAFSSLSGFYFLARACLVKSEAHYDQYDQAFQQYFHGIETPDHIAEEVLRWLQNPLPPLKLSPEEMQRLREQMGEVNLEELQRQFLERLREQKEEHHGGHKWIGTGGTSPFGHSGFHPGGIRVGGESLNRSAVKVAAERRYKDYRHDATLGVRQFEVALRRLRQFTMRDDGPADELDLDATIEETGKNAGNLKLVWRRSRKNSIRVALCLDVGGSMYPYMNLVSQLFTAVHRASHFKSLHLYYFHNCIYDHLYLDATCHPRHAVETREVLRTLDRETKLILVGDASMAPSELLMKDGIIWWGMTNDEPGIVWLRRLADHFRHAVWLNPIPAAQWKTAYGAETLHLIAEVFPMFELTVDGLGEAVKKLLVRK